MTLWLGRKEKVLIHQTYIKLATIPPQIYPEPPTNEDESDEISHIHISKTPSTSSIHFDQLALDYGAIDFQQALTVFVASYNQPTLSWCQLQNEAFKIFLPFQKVSVFHKIKLWNDDPLSKSDEKKKHWMSYTPGQG